MPGQSASVNMISATAMKESQLTILIVDDTRHGCALMTRFVERLCYRAVTASTSVEAVKAVVDEQPDLIIAALSMAMADGGVFVSWLNAASNRNKIFIMLMAGDADDPALIRALGEGADDYVRQPVRFPLLAAKIASIARTVKLLREAEKRNQYLAAYRATEQEEVRVAAHVIARLTKGELLNDPVLQHWVHPPGPMFSGDMVLAARTPSGDFHVLLADTAGRGLSAALNALPLTWPFYAMTEKGLPIESIVAEINTKIRNLLPIERFVAASVISVNFREQLIKVWNGGNPPVLILDAGGRVLFTANSRHPLLGVAEDAIFSVGMGVYHYQQPCQLFACSDGLVEAMMSGGPGLGMDGLCALLADQPADQRLDVVRNAVGAALGSFEESDDISVLLVDCLHANPALAGEMKNAKSQLVQIQGMQNPGLSLSVEESSYVRAVPFLLDLVKTTTCGARYANQIFEVLSAWFNDVLDHGLQPQNDACIKVRLAVVDREGAPMLQLCVKDTGGGSGYAKLNAAMSDARRLSASRPVVKGLYRDIERNDAVNEVVAYYALDCVEG